MQLKIIHTKFIPFDPYKIMTVLFWMLCKVEPSDTDVRHENIHLQQELEMLFIGFYLWYCIEFIVRLIQKGNWHDAYHAISFEQEAYDNEHFENYLKLRHHYAWTQYL